MQVSIRLPKDIVSLASAPTRGKAALHALDRALANHLSGVAPDGAARAAPVYLSTNMVARLCAAGADASDLRPFAEAMISGWALARRTGERPDATAKPAFPTAHLREAQVRLVQQLVGPVLAGRIAFAEASTGIGKSRAIAVLASQTARVGHRATIATPTLKLVAQMVDEFGVLGLQAPAIYLGKNQFVSPDLLRVVLADKEVRLPAEQREAITHWASAGAAPTPYSNGASLAKSFPGIAWLAADLAAIAPDLPLNLVLAGASDAEHPVYTAMTATWKQARVRIATHALIAAHIRLSMFGRAVLEDIDTLIVDEAHALHDAIESAFTDHLSLLGLRIRLQHWASQNRDKAAPGMTRAATREAVKLAQAIGQTVRVTLRQCDQAGYHGELGLNTAVAHAGPAARVQAAINHAASELLPDLRRMDKRATNGLHPLLSESIEACTRFLSGAPTTYSLSPRRSYPSIDIGRGVSGKSLAAFWNSMRAAALVSGSIYVDTASHGVSAGWFLAKLGVPANRVEETPAIISPWLTSVPTLHIPTPERSSRFTPPNSEDIEGNREWSAYYDAVAHACGTIGASARGGTLVLVTSYAGVSALAERLRASVGERLIEQKRGVAFAHWPIVFKGSERPVWVATGPAWTGLDVRQRDPVTGLPVPADEDFLLTDVIVPRLPVPAGARASTMSFKRLDTALRLRQGLGRLVRDAGQKDRRLWVLDGRLWSGARNHRYLTGPSRRVLEVYRNTVSDRIL